ncbi:MAG: hypothetical protein HYR50_15780, partial [Candidatus Rokubacteria bacterium]|nr:hypothetical protein [Candidatus Rokubacteria bacterium]
MYLQPRVGVGGTGTIPRPGRGRLTARPGACQIGPPPFPHAEIRARRSMTPKELAGALRRQLNPRRATWQKPAVLVRALGLRRGQVVAEIGSGPGYFTPRLARAVGPSGHVYAVD